MNADPAPDSFRSLIGLGDGPVAWRRFTIFIAAVLVSDMVQLFFSYLVGNPATSVFKDLSWWGVTALLSVVAILAGFRTSRSDAVAAVVAAVVYASLSGLRDALFTSFTTSMVFAGVLRRVVYFYVFVMAFTIFLRFIRPRILALSVATVTAAVVGLVMLALTAAAMFSPARFMSNLLDALPYVFSAARILSNLVGALALAVILWLFWREPAPALAAVPVAIATEAGASTPLFPRDVRSDLLTRLEAYAQAASYLSRCDSFGQRQLDDVIRLLAPVGGEAESLQLARRGRANELRHTLAAALIADLNSTNETLRQHFGTPETALEVQRIFSEYGI